MRRIGSRGTVEAMAEDVPRKADGTFRKGHSGNPAGRPKSLPDAVKQWRKLFPTAIQEAKKILESGTEKGKTNMIRFIAERAYGKSTIPIELLLPGHGDDEQDPTTMTDEEIEKILREEGVDPCEDDSEADGCSE